VPATINAIVDAVRWTERIIEEVQLALARQVKVTTGFT
jgi:hypothetical protein